MSVLSRYVLARCVQRSIARFLSPSFTMISSMRFVALVPALVLASAPVMAQRGVPAVALKPVENTVPDARLAGASISRNAMPALSSTPETQIAPQTVAPAPVVGPTLDAARAGVAPRESKTLMKNSSADAHIGAGQNVAMMVVGGAAFLTGLIIGGDGGTVIAIGGAAVGLYGLYNYIK
jgi:hypothetical protein